MSRFALDPSAIAVLAAALEDLATGLDVGGEVGADRWALGSTSSADALDAVLGDWRHERLALARGLRALGEQVRAAAVVYADAEAAVAGRLLTGGPW